MTAAEKTTATNGLKSDARSDDDRERPTSDESSGDGASVGEDELASRVSSAPVLTLSKARAIALVATVTGASFLNVSK